MTEKCLAYVQTTRVAMQAFSAVVLWTKKYAIYFCAHTYAHDIYTVCVKRVPYKNLGLKKYV